WYFFDRQFMWAVVGIVAFLVASRVDYHLWRKLAPIALVAAFGLLFVVLVPGIGITVDGSRRWLGYGPMRLQPSEFAKIALLVYAADVLARRAAHLHDPRAWRPVMVVLGGIGALVMLEPDLDSTVVLALIAFALLVLAGVPRRHLVNMALGFVGCLLVLGLFAGFGLVGFHVARRAPDLFGTLLAGGITVWIAGQAAINLGAVVGVLPVSGITLPFLSSGGSSLVIAMLAAG